MTYSTESSRMDRAWHKVATELESRRQPGGHWTAKLGPSPLATATAVSALVLSEQSGSLEQHGRRADTLFDADQIFQSDLSEMLVESVRWLASQQRDDGGWGDTLEGPSSPLATLTAISSLHLTGVPAKFAELLPQAEKFCERHGGVSQLHHAPLAGRGVVAGILTQAALSGTIPWRQLPLRTFVLPRMFGARWGLPTQEGAAIDHALYHTVAHTRLFSQRQSSPWRRLQGPGSEKRLLDRLNHLQCPEGSFAGLVPVTALIASCLSGVGLSEHPIVRSCVEYLLSTIRADGSWAMGAYPDVRRTAEIIAAKSTCDLPSSYKPFSPSGNPAQDQECLDWLLDAQQCSDSPPENESDNAPAASQGWSWTESTGLPTTVYDTARVVEAIAGLASSCGNHSEQRVERALKSGCDWLLRHQKDSGGWKPICVSPATELSLGSAATTAFVLCALAIRKSRLEVQFPQEKGASAKIQAVDRAIQHGASYLMQLQANDGSWKSSQHSKPKHANPPVKDRHIEQYLVEETSLVLTVLAETGYQTDLGTRRGLDWLVSVQHATGAWGECVPAGPRYSKRFNPLRPLESSLNATCSALAALLKLGTNSHPKYQSAYSLGLEWLLHTVENDDFSTTSTMEQLYGPLAISDPVASAVAVLEFLQLARLPNPPAESNSPHPAVSAGFNSVECMQDQASLS